MATLVSVNVGMPRDVSWNDRTVYTGAWKEPVSGPRRICRLNIDGDGGTGGISDLLNRISEGEGTSESAARENGFDTSYDVPLGYGRYAVPSKPVSQMTLGEIDELQSEMLSNPENDLNSSALGRYQITRTTLRSLKRQLGLSDDVPFDAELQDRLATALLEGRGLARYLGGEMSEQEFQRELAKEWASIANPDTGRALQHTGTTNEEIGAVLQQMRGR